MRNLYRLQTRDGHSYHLSSREYINSLIERGEAEWSGSDYDDDLDAAVHFADRIEP